MWPFKPKCAHDWHVKGTTVAKPCAAEFDNLRCGPDFVHVFQEITQGVTRFLLTCSKCGAVEVRRVLGVET